MKSFSIPAQSDAFDRIHHLSSTTRRRKKKSTGGVISFYIELYIYICVQYIVFPGGGGRGRGGGGGQGEFDTRQAACSSQSLTILSFD